MSFVYMLYAVDELNKKINIKNNGQLFLTGYSQGGHASFAAQKYLEELNENQYNKLKNNLLVIKFLMQRNKWMIKTVKFC